MKLCHSLDDIAKVAQSLLSLMPEGIVILQGNLAAGKTTLVKALALELGISEPVSSPTFSLQQCYDKQLFHYDIYNEGLEQFMALGLLEELEKEGLHLIEWGDERLVELLVHAGFDVLKVVIERDNDKRCYTMEKVG